MFRMNQNEVKTFVQNVTVDLQAKLNRKRTLAIKPLRNENFDAAAAINQPQLVVLDALSGQDAKCKLAFDNIMQYIIKVSQKIVIIFSSIYSGQN